jgi:murein hydrolase activator
MLSLGLLCFCSSFPAWAETAEDLQRVEQKLFEQKAEAAKLERKEKETAQEIGSLQDRLVTATEALQIKQNEQDVLEERLGALEDDIEKRATALAGTEGRLSSFTEALIGFRRQPPEAFLLRDSLTDDAFHRAVLLRALLPKLQKETVALSRELDDLELLRQQAAKQQRLTASAQQTLSWQRRRLDELVRMRQGSLKKTVEEKAILAEELAALAGEAKDLGQLVEKVSQSSAVPREIAPSFRHPLRIPVSGRVLYGFGDRDKFGVKSQGLTLRGAPESPVVAPEEGRVAFTGSFKGYGQIVILQHGGGCHSFLAGFGRIDVEAGQTVAAGEPLGILPVKGSTSSELYFEWRVGGEAAKPVISNQKSVIRSQKE